MNEENKIISIKELFEWKLRVPNYQRDYKWDAKNISELLNDMFDAVKNCVHGGFRYRIGTIILHKEGEIYNVVDGQQRCVSLLLLLMILGISEGSFLGENSQFSLASQRRIKKNYNLIRKTISSKNNEKDSLIKAINEGVFEVVVLVVEKQSEAFQLFDSQNTRGKPLNPHDLLKAHHLREMYGDSDADKQEVIDKMKEAAIQWQAVAPQEIVLLFEEFLFPIWSWCHKEKTHIFSTRDIDCFKGIGANIAYPFARRVRQAMPEFQLAEDFAAGKPFFDMVEHYLTLQKLVMENTQDLLRKIYGNDWDGKQVDSWYAYAHKLFLAVVFCYYDCFGNFDKTVLENLFVWAFMLRVNMQTLPRASVNKYAIGEGRYTNNIPVFAMIKKARDPKEFANLDIKVEADITDDDNRSKKDLLKLLKQMAGVEDHG